MGESATGSALFPAREPLELFVFSVFGYNPGVQPLPRAGNQLELGKNAARGNKDFVKIGCRLKSIHFVS